MEEIVPFWPIWRRKPNEFLRYEERDFDDGAGHRAVIRYALYLNKKREQCEEIAQVRWIN